MPCKLLLLLNIFQLSPFLLKFSPEVAELDSLRRFQHPVSESLSDCFLGSIFFESAIEPESEESINGSNWKGERFDDIPSQPLNSKDGISEPS